MLTTLILLAGCLVSAVVTIHADQRSHGPGRHRAAAAGGLDDGVRRQLRGRGGVRAVGVELVLRHRHRLRDRREREQTTNSTSNVYLDGNGHLVLKAINNGGTWTSGRIESTRDDFQAPPGGELEMTASIEQPNPANGLGYWPAFWALGSPMRTGGGWPTSGEIDMMEDVNGLNEASQTLHDAANSPGHPLIACPGAGSSCQTGYHTYSVIIDRTNTSAESLQFLMDGTVESTITEASVGTTAWQEAIDHGFFIIFDLAMGGNYPDGDLRLHDPDVSHVIRGVDERGVRGRVRAGRQLHAHRDRHRHRPGHRNQRAVPGQPELTEHGGQPDRRRAAATEARASSGHRIPTARCGPRAAAWTW